MNERSNSQVELEALIERCNGAIKRARDGGLVCLEAYRDAGATLLALKLLLPRGQFGPVADERCHCSKQWRARLMKLHRRWDDILSAVRWAEGCAVDLGRKAHSVDGALALLKKWRRATNGDGQPTPTARNASSRSDSLAAKNALLREQLSEARAYIASLERELAKLRPAGSDWQEVESPARFPLALPGP